ncbi:hypothetical protein [Streptomyces shenzhenensis]|uniref:hypothetical protein n=1 Tax=Streptomyces shenzhenensis TaxID=943815 RepID=UPI0011C44333|nr:hypothetical protein [Streptomyces shenzhenensis]
MPALRSREQEAARADLIALRLYLHSTEGPLSQEAVTRALRSYDETVYPYAACLSSALSRPPPTGAWCCGAWVTTTVTATPFRGPAHC